MKALRRLFLDGLLIAIPFACVVILAAYVVDFFREIVRPFVSFLPVDTLFGVILLTLCALLSIVFLVLLFGLIVRWKARGIVEAFESKVLNRIPIYQVLKRVSTDVVDPGSMDHAVLVDVHGTGAAQLGLLVEEAGEERSVVFLPESPSVMTGTVQVVPKERVHRLHVSGLQVIDALSNRGLAVSNLLQEARRPPA